MRQLLTSDQAKFLATYTGLPLAPLPQVIGKLLPIVMEKMAHKNEDASTAIDEALDEEKGAPA